jgi:hypothetical protein
MKRPTKLPSLGVSVLVAIVIYTGPVQSSRAQSEPPVLAVAEIQYIDTSGEVIDQSADHFRRLREFEASLRRDLARAESSETRPSIVRQAPVRSATSRSISCSKRRKRLAPPIS